MSQPRRTKVRVINYADGPTAVVYDVKFPFSPMRLFHKIADRIPEELKQTKTALALLAAIILPSVALICSIAFMSEDYK